LHPAGRLSRKCALPHGLVNQRFNLLFGHVRKSPGELFAHLIELFIQLSDALEQMVMAGRLVAIAIKFR